MKRLSALLALAIACHSHEHAAHDRPDEGHAHGGSDERPALSFTHWTDHTELFIELPALVKGRDSACAAHVTILEPFSPLARGEVSAVLRGGSKEERFASNAPAVPGIFRPVIRPADPGPRRLVVHIRSDGFSAEHDLGEVTVYADVAAARKALPAEAEDLGRITFLKEQQWPIEFATAVVAERSMRPTLRASGVARARTDGEVVVVAPAAGRLNSTGRAFPRPGERVTANDLLGVLAPRLEAADLASLELARKSAELEVRFADRERQRLEGLRSEGAVPERRVQDAVHAAEGARASLETSHKRLEQFRRVERTGGGGESGVQLRAPISGTITAVHVAPGTFVETGTPILRVTDLTQLWLEVQVAEVDIARLGTPLTASVAFEGDSAALELPAESLVARGSSVAPDTRTLALSFALDNAGARIPVGAYGRVFLAHGDERRALAVPEGAIVDDGGTDVAYVQVEGEAFERRIVQLGVRDRGFVEVRSGLHAGEHVATRGAWSVKLAASSGSVPAHGHSH